MIGRSEELARATSPLANNKPMPRCLEDVSLSSRDTFFKWG
jgi:hypothetical protein